MPLLSRVLWRTGTAAAATCGRKTQSGQGLYCGHIARPYLGGDVVQRRHDSRIAADVHAWFDVTPSAAGPLSFDGEGWSGMAPGVYGGHLLSHSAAAATRTMTDKRHVLHSVHCNFLAPGRKPGDGLLLPLRYEVQKDCAKSGHWRIVGSYPAAYLFDMLIYRRYKFVTCWYAATSVHMQSHLARNQRNSCLGTA